MQVSTILDALEDNSSLIFYSRGGRNSSLEVFLRIWLWNIGTWKKTVDYDNETQLMNSTKSLAHLWSPVIQKLDCDPLGRPAFECNWFATLVSTAPQVGSIPINGWLPGWSQPDPEIVTSTLLIHPSFCTRCGAKPSFPATTGLFTVLETASSREKTKGMIK